MKKENWQTGTLKKVLRYISAYRFWMAFSILLAVVTVILTLYIPILVGRAVDHIVAKGLVDFGGVLSVLIQIGVTAVVTAVLQWIMNTINNKVTYQVVRDVRNRAFEKIQILPLKFLDEHAYGGIVSRVIADVDQFADGLLMGFTQLFTGRGDDPDHADLHAHHPSADCAGGGGADAAVASGSPFYRKTYLCHVPAAVGDPGGADGSDRRDGWKPEGGAGLFL